MGEASDRGTRDERVSEAKEVAAAQIDLSQMLDMALTMSCFLLAKRPKNEIDLYFAMNDERMKMNEMDGGDTLVLVKSSVYLLHEENVAREKES